jgi:hypothetical protein
MKERHKIGDLVYFNPSRYDVLNRASSLGVIIKKDKDDNDFYYIEWLNNDFVSNRQLPYSATAIDGFKRQLRLFLEGFE